jgi:hypothetical protein
VTLANHSSSVVAIVTADCGAAFDRSCAPFSAAHDYSIQELTENFLTLKGLIREIGCPAPVREMTL